MEEPTNKQQQLAPKIVEKVQQLEEKYAVMGQDLRSYLEGLLHADYLTYWHYIHLDVLLSLQTPRTPFKDESIFIIYHQITELYFKLALHAIKQITEPERVGLKDFITQLKRVNSYFRALIHSFDIMIDGMDRDQFLQFRMALLPASGFQSAQYRMIEICSTNIDNLMAFSHRSSIDPDAYVEEKCRYFYWRQGATELETGKKTLTLKQFEKKYFKELVKLAEKHVNKNIWVKYHTLPEEGRNDPELIKQLKTLDYNANVNWPLVHYKTAVRYLRRQPGDIAATGGTNWAKYMQPKNQRIIFFPELWKEEELKDWGKKMILEIM